MENAIAANHSCFYSLDVLKITLNHRQSRTGLTRDIAVSARSEIIEDHNIADRLVAQQSCDQMTAYKSCTTCDKHFLHAHVSSYFCSSADCIIATSLLEKRAPTRVAELIERRTSHEASIAIPTPAIHNESVKKRGQ